MKKILINMLFLLPITGFARELHVGDITIPLHTEKITTPSINVKIENDIFYAPMVPWFISNRLHVSYNDKVFSVCGGDKTHIGNYWFIGDCLVGADDNVYLKIQNDATNGYANRINTGVNWGDSDQVVFTLGYAHTEPIVAEYYSGGALLFASQSAFDDNALGTNYITFYGKNVSLVALAADKPEITEIEPYIVFDEFKDLFKQNFSVKYNATGNDAITFGSWWDEYWSRTMKWYGIKIYNDNVLLRNFIPVPAGLIIGGYTVPQDGMWDTVEQKFYSNDGAGTFIYGVDE